MKNTDFFHKKIDFCRRIIKLLIDTLVYYFKELFSKDWF
jgi:hypothetical protein